MTMKRNLLIGYAMSFASFLLDSSVGARINRIILFGSVARGDFNEESDIDLFIDTDKDIEGEIDKLLKLFGSSRINEIWKLKGMKSDISVKVGDLKKWSLRRDVISSGITLYGKYNEIPEKVNYYLLIKIDVSKFKSSRQMSIWRKLYGYRQRIGTKIYTGKGLVERLGGKKIGKAIILIPMENRKEIINFLNKNRVSYTVNELWSDTL